MKDKRYKRMKKAIIAGASSGILAGMILMGSNTAMAETSDLAIPAYTQSTSGRGMHLTHRWNSSGKAVSLASGFGLDKDMVKSELKSGKTMKQILQENGIVLTGLKHKKSRKG